LPKVHSGLRVTQRITSHAVFSVALAAAAVLAACAGMSGGAGEPPPGPESPTVRHLPDTAGIIPAGFGSLHEDDLAIHVAHLGLSVRAIPLNEEFIRTLAPDSYRALSSVRSSHRAQLDSIAHRAGLQSLNVWLVSFTSTQQGEARFSPTDVTLTNMGRDYPPLDVIGLSPAFGSHIVHQREVINALMAFDGSINLNQILTLRLETETGGDWQTVLSKVEGERARIRQRANAKVPPPAGPGGRLSW
jgi:hypothetical protein